jgi:excisionase family DNA binding protein
MKYLSVAEMAKKWNVSERTVRNYCAQGRIPNAFLTGKTWNIPEDAQRPERSNKKTDELKNLLEFLRAEKTGGVKGGIYHKVQIELTYNSNRIEGSRLTHDQTRYIYETNTIGIDNAAVNVDDIVETANHFRCIDMAIEQANQPLSEAFIKGLHLTLANGTSNARKDWFAVGDYKKLPNEVGGFDTALPEEVPARMKELLRSYNAVKEKTLEDIIEFHYRFESIHPFQDGNGRVGRLVLFKECLRNNIVPFIIDDELKLFYYRGLREWRNERGFLMDTCFAAQDKFRAYLDYFRVPYEK